MSFLSYYNEQSYLLAETEENHRDATRITIGRSVTRINNDPDPQRPTRGTGSHTVDVESLSPIWLQRCSKNHALFSEFNTGHRHDVTLFQIMFGYTERCNTKELNKVSYRARARTQPHTHTHTHTDTHTHTQHTHRHTHTHTQTLTHTLPIFMNSRLFTRCQSASHRLITSVLVADFVLPQTQRTICYRVYMTAPSVHYKYNPLDKSVRLRYCAPPLLQKHPVTECSISKERSSQPHCFIGLRTYNPLIVVVTASKMLHCTARKYLCLSLYCVYMFNKTCAA